MDPIAQFKEQQKINWANFATLETMTGTTAPHLVRFAGIAPGANVLDVACGSGVVALTAAGIGAKVTGIDITPELIARAKENSAIMGREATWHEGDAEALPFPDASFDIVVSQFGHMFAPRPDIVMKEMLRVLKPGGTIAFSTWPPELFTGRMFALIGKYSPQLPPGISPPVQWGDPNIVRDRLGNAVKEITFTRNTMNVPTLSVPHYCRFMEQSLGPLARLLQGLDASDPAKSATLRWEIAAVAAAYFDNNFLRQDFLMTRAVKV